MKSEKRKIYVIATHNPAKFEELEKGLQPLANKGIRFLSLHNLHIVQEPEEIGKTFQENSLLKARFYGELCGHPTISDDGGLTINVLYGEPGVKSRRWIGYEAQDEELISFTLQKLQGVPKEKRTAYLRTNICFYDPKTGVSFQEEESIKGYIAEKPINKLTKGYPFRDLFIVEQFNKYYGELTDQEHNKINHRFIALKRLVKKIEEYLVELP